MTPRKTDTKSKTAKSAKAALPAKTGKSAARAKTAAMSRTKAATPRSKTASAAKASGTPKPAAAAKAARATRAGAKSTGARSAAAKSPARKPAVNRPAPAPLPPAAAAVPQGPVYQAEDRNRFEGILLEVRGRLLKELGHLEDTVLNRSLRDSSGELSGYSFHMADIGTDAMEREKAFLFASAEGRALLDINEALRRLYNGEYGNCEVCGSPISTARLEVVPQARKCISCKQEEERSTGSRGR